MQLSVSSLGSMALLQHQAVKSVWTPLNFQYPQTDRWLCYRDCIPNVVKCPTFSILKRIDGSVTVIAYPNVVKCPTFSILTRIDGSVTVIAYPNVVKCPTFSILARIDGSVTQDAVRHDRDTGRFQYPPSDRWLCYKSLRCSKNRKWSFSILPRIDGSVTASDERRQLHDVAFQYPRSDRWLGHPQFEPSHQYLTQNFQYPPSDRWLCYSFSLSFARPTVVNFQYPHSDRWLCYADCHLPGWLSNTFSILPRIDGSDTPVDVTLCFRVSFSILARIDGSVTL